MGWYQRTNNRDVGHHIRNEIRDLERLWSKHMYEINANPQTCLKEIIRSSHVTAFLETTWKNRHLVPPITDEEPIASTHSLQAEWDRELPLPSGNCRECQLFPWPRNGTLNGVFVDFYISVPVCVSVYTSVVWAHLHMPQRVRRGIRDNVQESVLCCHVGPNSGQTSLAPSSFTHWAVSTAGKRFFT